MSGEQRTRPGPKRPARLLAKLWRAVRRRPPRREELFPEEPPDGEPALVGAGPPRRPRPSSAVALELPGPEPEPPDAIGSSA